MQLQSIRGFQTISNLYLAFENDLEVYSVLNKVIYQVLILKKLVTVSIDLLGCRLEDIIHASGQTGFGVENILAAIIEEFSQRR